MSRVDAGMLLESEYIICNLDEQQAFETNAVAHAVASSAALLKPAEWCIIGQCMIRQWDES